MIDLDYLSPITMLGFQMTKPHLSVKLYIDQSNIIKTYDKQTHMANCEYLLLSISCEMNADQCLSWILMRGGAIVRIWYGHLVLKAFK